MFRPLPTPISRQPLAPQQPTIPDRSQTLEAQPIPEGREERTAYLQDLLEQAKAGDKRAQFRLGTFFYEGEIIPQNYTHSVELFFAAAKQGHLESQYYMGNIFRLGQGVDINTQEARKWYEISAEGGYAPAQYNLALMLRNGDGGTKDEIASRNWFSRAAEQGNADAQFALGIIYGRYDDYENQQQAVQWLRMAADQGHNAAAQKWHYLVNNNPSLR